MKTFKQLERYFKGVSNHKRIAILFFVHKNKEMTLGEISDEIKGNLKTTALHVQKLVNAGLLRKERRGLSVFHTLSPYGEIIIKFIKKFPDLKI